MGKSVVYECRAKLAGFPCYYVAVHSDEGWLGESHKFEEAMDLARERDQVGDDGAGAVSNTDVEEFLNVMAEIDGRLQELEDEMVEAHMRAAGRNGGHGAW